MDLASMFGNGQSILGQQLGLQKFDQDMTTGTINNANTLQQMFQNHQMNPLKVDHQRLLNEQLPVQTAGMGIDNKLKQLTLDENTALSPGKVALGQRKNEVELAGQDAAMILAQAERMMIDQNPQIRELGKTIFQNSAAWQKGLFEDNYKTNNKISEIDATGRNQRQNTQMIIDAGGYNRNTGNKGLTGDLSTDVEATLAKQKKASEKHNTLIDAYNRAAEAGNLDLAAQYLRRAEALRPQALAELKGSANPGSADLAGLGIQETPDRDIAPPGAASAPAGQPDYSKFTMQQWKQMYPKATEEQIRTNAAKKGWTVK